jgi:hypothetical protein
VESEGRFGTTMMLSEVWLVWTTRKPHYATGAVRPTVGHCLDAAFALWATWGCTFIRLTVGGIKDEIIWEWKP